MARGDFKADPRDLVRAHRRTYVDARTGGPRPQDVLILDWLPVATGVVLIVMNIVLPRGASVGLLTVCGLLSALLFGVLLQVSERAMDLADAAPEPGPAVSDHAQYLTELAANAGYASLICIAAAIAFVLTSVSDEWPRRVFTGVGLALGTHLVLVLLMTMKRVFALTVERLNRARTGADRHQPGPRRLTG